MLGPQPKTLKVTALRPFQLVLRDDNGEISERRVIKVGAAVSVDRALALELIATGKAAEGAAETKPQTQPTPARSGKE